MASSHNEHSSQVRIFKFAYRKPAERERRIGWRPRGPEFVLRPPGELPQLKKCAPLAENFQIDSDDYQLFFESSGIADADLISSTWQGTIHLLLPGVETRIPGCFYISFARRSHVILLFFVIRIAMFWHIIC